MMVMQVAPVSPSEIERRATTLLARIARRSITEPMRVDWSDVCDRRLPRVGVRVYSRKVLIDPATGCRADGLLELDPYTDEPCIILAASLHEALPDWRHPLRPRAVATLTHELAHTLLHFEHLLDCERRGVAPVWLPSRLVSRECNAEEQAWAGAGHLVAPRAALAQVPRHLAPHEAAARFGVSAEFFRLHLERLGLLGSWEADHRREKWRRPTPRWMRQSA